MSISRIVNNLFIFSFLCTGYLLEARMIDVGGHKLDVSIADTDDRREVGLMWRKKLGEEQGMLFIYDYPQTLSFWMKNTYIPLSVGFFDKRKVLLQITDMPVEANPQNPKHSYKSNGPAVYALEVPIGWFTRMNIKPGEKFSFLD